MLKAVRDSLLSLIYPQECRVCRAQVESRDDGVACSDCWASSHIFTGSEMLCDKCGTLLGERSIPRPVYCHKCDHHSYDKAWALGVYENALSASVVDLKSNPIVPARLMQALSDAAKRHDLARFDLLIPVPLFTPATNEARL